MSRSTTLGLSEHTKAVTAQYALGLEGKKPPRLLLIEYPDESEARVAFDQFGKSYFQEESLSEDRRINIVDMGGEEYNSITLNRNFIILVFEARHPNLCKKLVAETLAKIELHGRGKVY